MSPAPSVIKPRLLLMQALLMIGFVAGCRTECVAGTGCGGPVTYAVTLSGAPDNLGAIVLSIGSTDSTTVVVESGRSIPAQLGGVGTRRSMIIGALRGGTIARIQFKSIPAQPPVVTVLEAAATQAGGYLPIPPTAVQLTISEGSKP